MLNGKTILVTGGTGSFGQKFVESILGQYPSIKKVIIFSRDELKQYEMQNRPVFHQHKEKLRFFLGCVRDFERLKMACEGVDYLVHAAALKQVPAAEYNPMEFIKTNILGAENILQAALYCRVKGVVALSTDKAAAPSNLYGATKLCSDKLFIAANNIKGPRDIFFSVVRYGNVLGSRGSVIPYFLKQRETGSLTITHDGMTRFSISLEDGVKFVLQALQESQGGEIFVPKLPSYRILDVAQAVAPEAKLNVIGVRPGEKLHEEMITVDDASCTVEYDNCYVILPFSSDWDQDKVIESKGGKRVPAGFSYNSSNNTQWLNVETLREEIRKHIDPEFTWEIGKGSSQWKRKSPMENNI